MPNSNRKECAPGRGHRNFVGSVRFRFVSAVGCWTFCPISPSSNIQLQRVLPLVLALQALLASATDNRQKLSQLAAACAGPRMAVEATSQSGRELLAYALWLDSTNEQAASLYKAVTEGFEVALPTGDEIALAAAALNAMKSTDSARAQLLHAAAVVIVSPDQEQARDLQRKATQKMRPTGMVELLRTLGRGGRAKGDISLAAAMAKLHPPPADDQTTVEIVTSPNYQPPPLQSYPPVPKQSDQELAAAVRELTLWTQTRGAGYVSGVVARRTASGRAILYGKLTPEGLRKPQRALAGFGSALQRLWASKTLQYYGTKNSWAHIVLHNQAKIKIHSTLQNGSKLKAGAPR